MRRRCLDPFRSEPFVADNDQVNDYDNET